MSDSETEPESDVPSSPEKVSPSDPTDVSTTSTLIDSVAQLMSTPQTHSSDPISAVNSAVKILESLDFSLIRKVVSKSTNTYVVLKHAQDASLHGTIQESSTSLLEFLHVVLTISPTSAHDVRRMMECLAHLRRRIYVYNLHLLMRCSFSSAAVLPQSSVPVPTFIPRSSRPGAQKSRSRSHHYILGGCCPCKTR
jgi:hypothetical protein